MTTMPSQPADAGDTKPEPAGPLAMCPMAATCKGMAAKSFPNFLPPLPGLFFIALGVLLILFPALLVWFVAAVSIALGIMILAIANFARKMGEQLRSTHP